MKKKITRQGYRTLAIIWTLAAASIAVAFVRRLAEFNLLLLLLLALSVLTAANFWKCCKRTPEEARGADPFAAPPKFAENPILFDDDPNQNSEEKDHE